jgi:hypothetical protein
MFCRLNTFHKGGGVGRVPGFAGNEFCRICRSATFDLFQALLDRDEERLFECRHNRQQLSFGALADDVAA